jgi:lysophospholipase L1-like esterase
MKHVVLASSVLLILVSVTVAQVEQRTENDLARTFFDSKKVVFIGDSITYNGGFLTTLESCIFANARNCPKLLNLGLSSETCSGDSEPAHPWPRPNVHERLGRLLEKLQPDLLVVTYGMNDGIYHPFDEKRFKNYQAGIDLIIDAAEKTDSAPKVILVTPPPFDPLPVKKKNGLAKKDAKAFSWKAVYKNYASEVIAVYSKWILEQETRVAGCIDLRTPMLEALAERRKTEADFHFAHDGVHLDATGHEVMGNVIAQALGLNVAETLSQKAKKLIKARHTLLRDSWLTVVGHKRPNIKAGVDQKTAAEKENRLIKLLGEQLEIEKLAKEKQTKAKGK